MKGRKLEFRQKSNGQRIDHYDEASNIEYKNAGSGLAAGNVQEAISELAARPSGNGNTVVSSETYVKLEDFPGFTEDLVEDIPEWYDIRNRHLLKDYIFGVYPLDTDFESLAETAVPSGWKVGDAITWNEDNPRNWYFDKYRGTDGNANSDDGKYIDRYYNCIRFGKTDTWFYTISDARTKLQELDDTYGIFVASRIWNAVTGFFERFENPVLLSESTLTEEDLTTSTEQRLKDVKDEYYNRNEAIIDRAKRTREFLQSVFDSADPDTTILFPYNSQLIVGFHPKVYAYGDYTTAGSRPSDWDNVIYDYYAEQNKYTQYPNHKYVSSLFIYHKLDIDLNSSMLTILPNWHSGYSIIEVKTKNTIDPYATERFENMPGGGMIYNGTFKGDYDNHIFFPVAASMSTSTNRFSKTHEFCSGVSVKDAMSLSNLTIYNYTGDGVGFTSPYNGISDAISCNTRGRLSELDDNGTIVNDTQGQETGYWYSNKININTFHPNRDRAVIARPKYPTNSQQNKYFSSPELAPYFIDEEYAVVYYDDTGAVLKTERLCFGDNLNIPTNAATFRFFIHIDVTTENGTVITSSTDPGKINIMLLEVDWKLSSVIENCEIYNCGRNGITPTSMKNGAIRNCNIYDCGFMTNQIAIDIEGVAGIDSGFDIDDLWIHGKGGSITSVTGDHVYITKCKVGGINTSQPYLHIEDCECNSITATTKFFNNIVKPKRVVQNTIIRKSIQISNGYVSNCRIRGEMSTEMYNSNSKYPSIFENCIIRCKNLAPGIYRNCNINIDNRYGDNNMYVGFDVYRLKDSDSKQRIEYNRYVFEDCKIIAESLYGVARGQLYSSTPINPLLNFRNCDIELGSGYTNGSYEDTGSHFLQAYIESFVNNRVSMKVRNEKPGIRFVPYGTCSISGNVFKITNEVTTCIPLMLKFYKTSVTKSYSVKVEDNTFEYVGTTSNTGIVIEETAKTYKPDSNVNVSIKNNVFYKTGSGTAITPYSVGSMTAAGCSFTVDADNNMAVNGGTLNVQNNG